MLTDTLFKPGDIHLSVSVFTEIHFIQWLIVDTFKIWWHYDDNDLFENKVTHLDGGVMTHKWQYHDTHIDDSMVSHISECGDTYLHDDTYKHLHNSIMKLTKTIPQWHSPNWQNGDTQMTVWWHLPRWAAGWLGMGSVWTTRGLVTEGEWGRRKGSGHDTFRMTLCRWGVLSGLVTR